MCTNIQCTRYELCSRMVILPAWVYSLMYTQITKTTCMYAHQKVCKNSVYFVYIYMPYYVWRYRRGNGVYKICVFVCMYIILYICTWYPPKMREIALWSSTNGAIAHFLVLPGSLLSITEITEYRSFGPLKPRREFKYKSQ